MQLSQSNTLAGSIGTRARALVISQGTPVNCAFERHVGRNPTQTLAACCRRQVPDLTPGAFLVAFLLGSWTAVALFFSRTKCCRKLAKSAPIRSMIG